MNASALEAILYLAIQAPDNYLAIQSFYCLLSNQFTIEFFWRNIDISRRQAYIALLRVAQLAVIVYNYCYEPMGLVPSLR
jgi:hypothetical protein